MAADYPVYNNTRDQNPRGQLTQYSQKPPQVQLTQEEIRVLRECNNESFYYRSLPFAIAGMAATHLAIQRGIFKSHPKYGPTLKLIGAAFCGWVLGKFSYRKTCEEKFLHLQNSSIADAIRKKRGLIVESFTSDAAFSAKEGGFSTTQPMSSDQDYHSSYGALNLDTDKNVQYSDFNDRLSADNDTGTSSSEGAPIRPTVTYEELRQKNREQAGRQSPPSHNRWDTYRPPAQKDGQQNEGYVSGGMTKNTYGDLWEK